MLWPVPAGYLLAVRRSTWRRIGGVDAALSPAFYEEVDLAFRVSKVRLQVVSVGNLDAVHDCGVSAASRRRKIDWAGGSATRRVNR
jgi:GT2 family glycosyltransferase